MRVAMVCPYDLSVPGGVQSQVRGLAESLGRQGVAVWVVAPSSRPGGAAGAYRLVVVGRSLSFSANGSRAPVAPGPAAMARTLAALRRLRADLVHVHEPLVPGPSLAALLAGPRPLVATFHRFGCDPLYRAEGVALRGAARRIDASVAVSEAARATARLVLGRHAGAMELIPNGVDLAGFGRRPRAEDGAPSILFVGRHEERKGLAVLLEAFGRLRAGGAGAAGARLLVVGEGPETAALREATGDDPAIEWLGAVDDVRKARLLGEAAVFVAPSLRGESFGVVLLEAMAAGAPVIASDLPGYRLAAGEAARFVPPGDAKSLAAALAEVLGDAAERGRLVEAGGRRVEGFSMDAVAGRYLRLYAGVAAART